MLVINEGALGGSPASGNTETMQGPRRTVRGASEHTSYQMVMEEENMMKGQI